MIHVGDITKLDGAALEPVDCIVGGSPCQDLSVAGKRAGLAGERSGLFMEQIRVIKEMREHDKSIGRTGVDVRPRFAVWENVVGAYSSNGGEDFRAVLEEFVRIAEPEAVIPRPPKGKWEKAGVLLGDGYSLAWRTHDAQYWGVPQRRRRISVVVDFAGGCATEISFERESLSGHTDQSGAAGQSAAGNAETRAGGDDSKRGSVICLDDQGGAQMTIYEDGSIGTLRAETHGNVPAVAGFVGGQGAKAGSTGFENERAPSLRSSITADVVLGFDGYNQQLTGEVSGTIGANCGMSTGRNGLVYDARGNGDGGTVNTLTGDHQNRVTDYTALVINKEPMVLESNQNHATISADGIAPTLPASMGLGGGYVPMITEKTGDHHAVVYGISSYDSNAMKSPNPNSGIYEADTSRTLDGNGGSPSCNQGGMAVVEPTPYTLQIRSGCEGGGKGALIQTDKSATLSTHQTQTRFQPYTEASFSCQNPVAYCIGNGQANQEFLEDRAGTLNCMHDQKAVLTPHYIVRRLTPIECERLQGFPDGHTDIGEYTDTNGKKRRTSDSARYRALGNSIALPYWRWLFERMAKYLPEEATLGSLFDGIGGFPLCWEAIHGLDTARWASEIDEFCIAVTKRRFGEE